MVLTHWNSSSQSRYVPLLGYIMLTSSQAVFALIPWSCMLRRGYIMLTSESSSFCSYSLKLHAKDTLCWLPSRAVFGLIPWSCMLRGGYIMLTSSQAVFALIPWSCMLRGGYIMLTSSQAVFAFIPWSCMLRGEATNINFLVFEFTQQRTAPMI
jgi:hypothetical protein